ncbi:Imm32 family immunity protein [Streptomyces europaeiscabiei]|uniref:Imm32 family immunity protein n=1 Tax=Streptomyces europaeiscabiei TaxID=146819 RepID=UPI00069C5942|nr:hypothetical protein [Streptomyces europaeiscabiei]MDX2773766.1 hypothetical protein [Streptomyces europaeiscabiei]MDX3667605.1 hypothetical protein [Streptomyces europaeiscabiei]MDX3776981.1 hypothetical protein [Streptomyces europaeiscabiei]
MIQFQSQLVVRCSAEPGEVEVSGSVNSLGEWANALTRDDVEISTSPGDDPSPYPRCLTGIRVRSTAPGLVKMSVDVDRQALTFTGSGESMKVLAENILGLCREGVPGDHLHIEYFPDHFYLAESRISLVVERAD